MDLRITIFLVVGALLVIAGSSFMAITTERYARRRLSKNLRLGTILFAFVAALPELMMSIMASAKSLGTVAVSTPIGSGVINLLLLCGLAAVVRPMPPHTHFPKKSIPIVIAAAVFVSLLAYLGGSLQSSKLWILDRWAGALLVFFYLLIIYFVYARINSKAEVEQKQQEGKESLWRAIMLYVLSLALIVGGAYMTTDAALMLILRNGNSQELIGLLLLAPISAIPELVAIIQALQMKTPPYFFKDLFNSTTSNLLLVLGFTALIFPVPVYNHAFIDLAIICFASILVLATVYFGPGQRISRGEGIVILAAFVGYVIYVVLRQPDVPNLFF